MSVFIIAEAGVNHNGSLELAKKLVDAAKEAGADCVKFQTFVSKNIVSKKAIKAEYQKQQTDSKETQYEMLKRLELSFDDFVDLKAYCKSKNIEFMSTAFDLDSIDFLEGLGMDKWKIPSGDITNLPYLIKIARLKRPVILSTGMSTMDEISCAINALRDNGVKELTVLHCTTEYPTPFADVNLRAMLEIRDEFDVSIGYSDHTNGIEVSIAAVSLGAEIIEKHFTLDKNMDGPDHKASLEPYELKAMVESIRNIESALGDGMKQPVNSEKKNIEVVRKSIVAKHSIKEGELLTEDNLAIKRPGNGLSPMKWFEIVGTIAIKDFDEDEMIRL